VEKHLTQNVEGTEEAFSDANIAAITDVSKLKKYYKLNGLPWLDKIKDENEKRQQMDGLVLSAMALRGA
jgi:EKC/KEOPS complex subunit TPRKB/CGI121